MSTRFLDGREVVSHSTFGRHCRHSGFVQIISNFLACSPLFHKQVWLLLTSSLRLLWFSWSYFMLSLERLFLLQTFFCSSYYSSGDANGDDELSTSSDVIEPQWTCLFASTRVDRHPHAVLMTSNMFFAHCRQRELIVFAISPSFVTINLTSRSTSE